MRRVRYSVAMSLDGYIAGPKGESDWIVIDPEIDFNALFGAVDTILLGRKTYEATRQTGNQGGTPGMETYVFSRTLHPADCPGVRTKLVQGGDTISAMASTKGTIKRLIADKGFGFVASDDGNEYFFHQSACQGVRFDDLREGQSVTFDKGQGPKGPRAENVSPA